MTITGKNIATGKSVGQVAAPAYLFRGESTLYSTTTATIQRVPTDQSLTERARNLLPGLSNLIAAELGEFLSLSQMDSVGFAQHYGLPTELIDLTASPQIAGYFASSGQPGDRGLVGVFPTEKLSQFSTLIDLRNHEKAYRPRLQQAFAIYHRKYTDLKSDECVAQLESNWFGFTMTEEDKAVFGADTKILDAHTDSVAGALQLVIDSMISEHGKLPDELALWLSERIAVAPFVTRPVEECGTGRPTMVELISADEAGFVFDEEEERKLSYQLWSSQFELTQRQYA